MRRKKNPRNRIHNVVLVTRSAGVSSAPESSVLSPQITRAVLPCEIRIVDEEKREIELCATSEAIDSYKTVFGYDASKDAFNRWAGNVREMHERKAVGRKVAVRYDDAAQKVYTRIRVSKGAQDTWEKVKDGTLAGASIGAANVEWENRRIGGEDIPYARRYDLVELSLVDLPSNPDAAGVTFVRDGVPDDALLDALETLDELEAAGIADDSALRAASSGDTSDAPAAANGSSGSNGSTTFAERDGSLSTEDPAAAIAAAALARGQQAIQATSAEPEPTAKQRRLAALGAPGYQQFAASAESADRAATSAAPGEGTSGDGVGQPYDVDGDHETPEDYVTIQSGPTAGAVMAPSPEGSVAHMAHSHHHTGHYDDPSNHRESTPHQHLDGTSHVHEHVMDHDHGGHEGVPNGHTHPHIHIPDHGHYFRVADGSPIDSRLVTGEQVRTHEYVSASAFRAAEATEGQPLSADQFRVAASHDVRALGPYSRNPDGPADAGTPDVAPVAPSADLGQTPEGNGGSPALDQVNLEDDLRRTGQCPLCHGQVRALDQDGKPIPGSDANGNIPDAPAISTVPMDGRAVVAEITRSLQPQYAALAGSIHDLAERLQRIEQTPQTGGPVLRAADRGSAFHAGGVYAAAKPTDNERYAALESLAGKISDPQVQTAVAAEMIRMQQEAAGMPTSYQVMPRAGAGPSR